MTDRFPPDPAHLFGEAAQMLGSLVNELVPPEAQLHLLNAQRELLLAFAVTIEHHRRRDTRSHGTNRPVRVELE